MQKGLKNRSTHRYNFKGYSAYSGVSFNYVINSRNCDNNRNDQ